MRRVIVASAIALVAMGMTGCGKKASETSQAPPSPPIAGAPAPRKPGGPPGPGAAAANAANVAAGKAIFNQNCARCHGPDGRGRIPGQPNFTNASWQKGQSDQELTEVIQNGHERMPAFKGRLTDQQIRDVLGYVRSFAVGSR